MTRTVFRPDPPLPAPERVLWRAGTPPSQAGARLEALTLDVLKCLAREVCPSAQALTGMILPEPLREDFGELLRGSVSWTVLLATLGPRVDEEVQRLQDLGENLRAHLYNAAASETVELLAGSLQLRMASDLPGMTSTPRYAPGYGAIPLSAQKPVTDLFPGMDVTCTESFYLVPSKTLSAVWGWTRPGA